MAGRIIRWLHLSDFHVGKDDYAVPNMFTHIIEHVGKMVSAGSKPDFIFITGDVADKGKLKEYESFNLEFLLALQESTGIDFEKSVFIVPGNHDADRTKNKAFTREEMLDPKEHYFDPTAEGLVLREIILPRFKIYETNDWSAQKGLWVSSEAGAFAHCIEDDFKVGIVGINTAWLNKDKNDKENLTPGKHLVEQILEKIKDCPLKIVLGHHPLDWFNPLERKMLTALFGKHSVLYLHGHLHDAWAEPAYGSGGQFFTVQSGAAFQAREGERWRNGFVWAEVDVDAQVLRLQPWEWSAEHQDWCLVADAFPPGHRQKGGDVWEYHLPGTVAAKTPLVSKVENQIEAEIPQGWAVFTYPELKAQIAPLSADRAICYFDGAVPGWNIALSPSIPQRKIVQKLVSHLDTPPPDRPVVVLLLAAGCEGKTTALLQAAYAILEQKPTWKIIRRSDEGCEVNPKSMVSFLESGGDWLVVVDEADNAAQGLFETLQKLPAPVRGKVHFLLACRNTDWVGSGANALLWNNVSMFCPEQLTGLAESDAAAIILAWTSYGDLALGTLARLPVEKRASSLLEAAQREATVAGGALFGALLTVRLGDDLHNHARIIIERLGERTIPSGGTLRDALGYIAAMHAEGLEFLSRPVLASALGCPLDRLRRDVLLPLGNEAAATVTSKFILTRHRKIAQAIISVSQGMGLETDGLFVALAVGATDAARSNHFIPPNISWWRNDLPDHFFNNDRQGLAILIAEALYARESSDSNRLVKLAQLLRKTDDPKRAMKLFEDFPSATINRGFYHEWATTAGNYCDHGATVLLDAYSLADECDAVPPNNDRAKLSLAGLGVAFKELYGAYHDRLYLEGLIAVALLGKQLDLDKKSSGYFDRHLQESLEEGASLPTIEDALRLFPQTLQSAIIHTHSDRVKEICGSPKGLSFEGLTRLIGAAVRRKQLREGSERG